MNYGVTFENFAGNFCLLFHDVHMIRFTLEYGNVMTISSFMVLFFCFALLIFNYLRDLLLTIYMLGIFEYQNKLLDDNILSSLPICVNVAQVAIQTIILGIFVYL